MMRTNFNFSRWLKYPTEQSAEGFSLAEVLGAAAILILVMTSLAAMLQSSHRLSGENHSRVYAVEALREEMETLRAMNFTAIDNLQDGDAFVNTPLQDLRNGAGTRVISDIQPGELRQISLRVNWEGPWGEALSEEVTTFFGKDGLTG